MTLTNPKPLSDAEYVSLDSIHSTFTGAKQNPNEQTFHLTLNGKGSAYFFYYTEHLNLKDSSWSHFNFYLKLNDSVCYRSPNFSYPNCCFEKILAVSFSDINSDGFTDVIVLGQFYRGYGSMEQKYSPQYIFDIYFGAKNKFITDRNSIDKLAIDLDKKITIDDIKKAYSKQLNADKQLLQTLHGQEKHYR
jgi:hypothetical protein